MSDIDIYECGDCLKQFYPDGPWPISRDCPYCDSANTLPFSGPDADHAAESKFQPDRAESMYAG